MKGGVMGRNQYGITNTDMRELRESFDRLAALTPEERAKEKASLVAASASMKAEQDEQRRRASQEKIKAEVEKQKLLKEGIERLNIRRRAAGRSELSVEPIDPHFEMGYAEYLQSALWRKIRRRVLERDEGLCRICGGRATQVHHRTYHYDVIVGKNDEACVSLCARCHKRIEFTPEGERRSIEQKESFLVPLLKKE
jgi:hypothetical protein